MPTCALDGFREATHVELLDGRPFHVCDRCGTGTSPSAPRSPHRHIERSRPALTRVAAFVGESTVTVADVARHLRISHSRAAVILQSLEDDGKFERVTTRQGARGGSLYRRRNDVSNQGVPK